MQAQPRLPIVLHPNQTLSFCKLDVITKLTVMYENVPSQSRQGNKQSKWPNCVDRSTMHRENGRGLCAMRGVGIALTLPWLISCFFHYMICTPLSASAPATPAVPGSVCGVMWTPLPPVAFPVAVWTAVPLGFAMTLRAPASAPASPGRHAERVELPMFF